MKSRNNKGFTLVEMLVALAIVAVMSIALGVGATNAMNSSLKTDYAEKFKELFKNANIYVEYSTTTCNLDSTKNCTVTLNELVNSGLLDSDYYKTANPYKKTGNFTASDTIIITLSNGRKTTAYGNKACGELTNKNVDNFEHWGEC